MMTYSFSDYESLVNGLAQYPNIGSNLVYPSLGLVGEAGEVAEKVKKLWRNKNITSSEHLSGEDKDAIIKEMGDVLWYLAALAREVGTNLEHIAYKNAEKLLDRNKRNVVKSEGDNR